ncbi:hypothetical protein [Paenibacillus hunanensis]|uniref:DUF3993 domain-containing protein n=1 Tax=Paenibacillus hunanensis TaxID=539262 RepID=A0ABU1IWR5_9BACL|nr:hypothetical protein [Paenibacillus hunanensis]MCL9661083.1 hypothetical protein [Paenibacillus hunanensis]MDR6243651.1 hypothetical protein [Paenibacillus hunanensis]WPP42241.1 hypothetical protein SK066_04600 [Paenibacillus hunanensis]GGJ23670.1 hypothetical protein GCM10008022_35800 [Paenibacillus hunanensis]
MSNAIMKIFAALLALLLMGIWPIYTAYSSQDNSSQIVALNAVTRFVDSVRDKGYITPTMMQQFKDQLFLTGNTYDIQMEHQHKRYDPVYDDDANFKNTYQVHYEGYYNSQIEAKLFPAGNDNPDDPVRVYKLSQGDFFSVTVKNTNRTMATLMGDMLFGGGNAPNEKIVIPYGGMILNEDY